MDKVYIVEGQTISYDDVHSSIAGVHTTEEGARKRMREEIKNRCIGLYDKFKDEFEDEDYAEDYENYETFEEFWNDWVDENYYTSNFWRYSDETDLTYIVSIAEKYIEN